MLKNTPSGHPDHSALERALKEMEDIVAYVNEGQKQEEDRQKIVEIQKLIDPSEVCLIMSALHI